MVTTRNGQNNEQNNDQINGQNNGQNSGSQVNGQIGVQDLAQLLQAFITAATNIPRQPHAPHTPQGPLTRSQALNEFCKRRPPIFYGEPNPTLAEAWFEETKKVLKALDITGDSDCIALTTYQMQGEAQHWWKLIETTHNTTTMTFEGFEKIFLDKYFPTPVKQAMVQEFMTLKQGNMTVTQYAARFEELSRHAKSIVPTDEDKARKFEWGLGDTRKSVMAQSFRTYSQVVQCALMMEREATDSKSSWKGNPTAGGPIRTNSNQNNNRGNAARPYYQNNSRPQQQNQPWQNPRQGQNQAQNRNNEPVRCYNCHELGHYKNSCPYPWRPRNNNYGNQPPKQTGYGNLNQGGPNQQRPSWNQQPQNRPYQNNGKGQGQTGANQGTGGRIFALQADNEELDPSVIRGTEEDGGEFIYQQEGQYDDQMQEENRNQDLNLNL